MSTIPKFVTPPSFSEISEAHEFIKPYIHKTPIMTCSIIDNIAGCKILFKCENLQKIGAFKIRGGSCAGLSLTKEELSMGLATHSSGNHAQAIALTAQNLGTKSYIVMPEDAPKTKKAATEGYGASIIECASTVASRQSTLDKVVEETGATFIHPFDDFNVIAGQATCSKELVEEVGTLDSIITPIGGGGMMCGTALTISALMPKAKIYGSEPLAVDDAYRSFHSGHIETNKTTRTIADGLRTNLSEKTFNIIRSKVDDIFTVEEEEIIDAMKLIWTRMKILIEPSSAVPLAAILKNKKTFAQQKVGVILTGGNVDLENLPF